MRRLGHYRLLRELGRGGMGRVYLAEDTKLGRRVALKLLPPELASDPGRLARLEREARAAAALNDSGIVHVYALEEADGEHFLTMEYVEGEVLATPAEGLPTAHLLDLATQLAAAVAAAHEAGVVHRDLKPANVIVTKDGRIKVCDFGLAKRESVGEETLDSKADTALSSHELHTKPGTVMGTAPYMSPEQVRGERVDARSDVFSLGVMLYEMAAGRRPFKGRSRLELFGAITSATPERLDRARPSRLPAPLIEVIDRCLAKASSERYSSARELHTALVAATDPARPKVDGSRLGNVTAGRDGFVGREEELAELGRWLGEGARLLTVLGTGGTGKTRLVREFGARHGGRWPGGAWFCDLTESRSAVGIASAVAAALDVPLGKGDPVVQLGHAIAGRSPCLIILDNFEQVADYADATLGHWLERTAEAQFLVTSRVRLELAGEEEFLVEPLPLERDGVALFELRGRARRRDFAVTDDNHADVLEVVRLLDGLPLAIELAAARIRLLSVSQIRERLRERFGLLTSGRRSSHHATLRSCITWSWDLLEGWEQSALAQCSVFEGGWTMAAAEAVVDLTPYQASPSVLDTIESLVDRSLLRIEAADEAAGPRMGMLVSIHDFAAEKLAVNAEQQATEARHGRHYAELGSPKALAALATHEAVKRRRTLERELDNLVAATRRAVAAGDGNIAGPAALATWAVMEFHGPLAQGRKLLRAARSVPDLAVGSQAELACGEANSLKLVDELEGALSLYSEALELYREVGDSHGEVKALLMMSDLHFLRGEDTQALDLAGRGLGMARGLGDRRAEAVALSGLGGLESSEARLRDAGDICREVGDRQLEGVNRNTLGRLQVAEGRLDEALGSFEESLAALHELGDRAHELVALRDIGVLHEERGALNDARAKYEEALALARNVGRYEAFCLVNLATLNAKEGRSREARDLLERAIAVARETNDRRGGSYCAASFAELEAREGKVSEARAHFDHGEALLHGANDRFWLGVFLCRRGEFEHKQGDHRAAHAALSRAEALAEELGATSDSRIRRHIVQLRHRLKPGDDA